MVHVSLYSSKHATLSCSSIGLTPAIAILNGKYKLKHIPKYFSDSYCIIAYCKSRGCQVCYGRCYFLKPNIDDFDLIRGKCNTIIVSVLKCLLIAALVGLLLS